MEDDDLNAKQAFLRESILEKGYDAEDFMQLLQTKKGESGLDLMSWTMNELKEAVKEFTKDKAPDYVPLAEEEKKNENKINEEDTNADAEEQSAPQEVYDLDKFCQDHPEGSSAPKELYGKCTVNEVTEFSTKEGIVVKVSSPEKVEGGIFSKSYVSYLVVTEPFNYKTRKRYSEFLWLRKTLSIIYSHCVIPPLCKKNFVDRFTEALILKRMRSMEKFMQGLLIHPLIKNSQILYDFLSTENDSEFRKKKHKYSKMTGPTKVSEIKTLEEYVSGNMRFYFIKHAVVDKEEDSTPIIYEQHRQLVPDHTKKQVLSEKGNLLLGETDAAHGGVANYKTVNINGTPMKEIISTTRSLGCQTLMRESEAQTIPAPFGTVKQDNTFQEIFELKDFHYGHGLPVEMHDIELIAKAREKRAFNDALPPLSDEANFNLRNKLTNEQETREWRQKEKEIEEINEKRLLTLQQFLENREKEFEAKRLEKIDRLKEKKDEEVEAAIIKSRKRRVKIIRNISKMKDKFINNNNRKRDIILDYASFGSKVYAPLTRDGHNPDRHPFKFELNSYSLNTYDGLSEIESEVCSTQNTSMASITKPKMEKQYNNSLSKLEKVHIKAIKDAFDSIQKQEKKKKEEENLKKKRAEEENRNKSDQNKKVEEPVEKNLILEDVLLFQRLLRGRKEQIEMQEGRKKRAELIKELKQADEWKSSVATAEEQKLIDNYKEKLTNGVVDAIQGDNISKTLDYLSKELVRIKEEQKINAIVMMAENERRKREAEEMGRRQAENILRDRQDIMTKELQEVNQATMDSYINSLFTNTVNKVSKKQVIKEIEIKANKLNRIVDKIEDKFVKDDVRIRDLVSSFIIPEIERKKKQDQIELEEKRFIERAKVAINTSLRNAENEYGKKDEIKESNNEDEEDEKEEAKEENK